MKNQMIPARSQGASGPVSKRSFVGVSAAAVLGTLMLTACGGDIVDEIVEVIVCPFANCKQSDTLALTDISPRFTVTQENGQVKVEGRLGQSANLITVVQPSGNDHMSASVGNQRRDLMDEDGHRRKYSVFLADASEQPLVTANFVRGGELHGSTVTLPKPFSVVAPTGTPMIARSSGKFLVQLSQPYSDKMSLELGMVCKRADGSSFDGKRTFLTLASEANSYRIDTWALDKMLNDDSLAFNPQSPNSSPVQTCELKFQWMLSQTGTVASTLNRHASIVAKRYAIQAANYDARL